MSSSTTISEIFQKHLDAARKEISASFPDADIALQLLAVDVSEFKITSTEVSGTTMRLSNMTSGAQLSLMLSAAEDIQAALEPRGTSH